jgi:hypothetical protein
MGGQHDISNHQIAVKFPQELFRKIEVKATERKMTAGQYIRFELGEMLLNVKLSDSDMKIVADRIRYGTTFKK